MKLILSKTRYDTNHAFIQDFIWEGEEGEGDTAEVLGGADTEGSYASFVTVFDIIWVQISKSD